MTVFFSFFSTIILIALYFLFIAKQYTMGIDYAEAGGISMPLDANAKNFIVYLQMMAGVMILNSMSLATGAFSTIARDFENKRFDSLMLTPVKTHEMILAYFSTGLISSVVLNTFTWLISFLIIGLTTGYWLALSAFTMVLLVLLTSSLISSSFMILVTASVKSSAAIGVINGVAGTFFGFLCGIYMPYSNLGEGTKMAGSFFPFTHLTIWMKQTVLDDAFSQLGIEGEMKEILLRDFFSADGVGLAGFDLPLWMMIVFSGVFGLLCLIMSFILLHKRINGQRG